MQTPDLPMIFDVVRKFARTEFGLGLTEPQVEPLIRSLLWDPRNLLQSVQAGLITQREASSVVADHLVQQLAAVHGRRVIGGQATLWEPFVQDIEAAIFGQLR